nr:hypothetical protein OG781_01300 [Streptomyces sp. NBC_00830]WTB35692.1 hypothetical protein OG781_45280 [Streptomyces sp. NBC_00830]
MMWDGLAACTVFLGCILARGTTGTAGTAGGWTGPVARTVRVSGTLDDAHGVMCLPRSAWT